jgi:CRP-like cAMP-binding protein
MSVFNHAAFDRAPVKTRGAAIASTNSAQQNQLLAALPPKDYQRLLTVSEPVALSFGSTLYELGKAIRHVYFPINCVVSLLTMVEKRHQLEVGLVGYEGMVGVPLALGISVSPVRAQVQCDGMALRMTSAQFLGEYATSESLRSESNRYIHNWTIQHTQIAACNRFHRVDARLARWLLMTRDRTETDDCLYTQQHLGNVLGVRRSAVTIAAGNLQRRKLISYSRGKINILDAKGLEAAACSCYKLVKQVS